MKRLLLTIAILLLTAAAHTAVAQRIAYGERTPRLNLKNCSWLDDKVPAPGEFVYIGFVYSRSNACLEFCERIKRRMARMEHPMQVILVTREPEDMIHKLVHECLGDNVGTIIDHDGHIFREFGVRYVPFAVLIDDKRRAIWFGNPLTGDRDVFTNTPRKEIKKRKKHKSERWPNSQK